MRIPLTNAVVFGQLRYVDRDYTIVRVTDDEGATGFSYSLGRAAPLAATVRSIAPIAVGTDPSLAAATWDSMYTASIPFGQRGLALRAISLIDVATWDLLARKLSVAVHVLLGGARTEVPVSVGGGYYRERRDAADVREEMTSYVERGFPLVKVPAGGWPAGDEERWVGLVRDALGDGTRLAVDAHWTWNDPLSAAEVIRRIDRFDLAWVEDPLWPEATLELSKLRQMVASPLAIGDELSGRWVYRDLIERSAADIFRVDVTTAGGFTEFVRIAALAESSGIPVSTHIYPELHVHCAAGREIVRWIEYVDPTAEIDMASRFIDVPLQPEQGVAKPPQTPGLGFELDWEWIAGSCSEHFTVTAEQT